MLFPYLLKVSLLLAVVTLGYRWMVQFESYSRLNRALLWLNVIAAWALPAIPLPDWGPTRIQSQFHEAIPKIARAAPEVKHQIAPYNPAPSLITSQRLSSLTYRVKSMNLLEWAWIVYVTGVLIMLTLFLFQFGNLIRILVKSPGERSDRSLVFVRNSGSNAPYSFFHWVVINPENHTPNELRHIIAHETEHAIQWHSLDLIISEMQRIVLWFNPFAWFHQKLVQANLEYLADRAVLEGGFEKKQYQYSLVNAVLQKNPLPMTSSFAQSLLKNRIKMMNKKPSHDLAWGKYALLIGMLYFSSAFVAPYTMRAIRLTPNIVSSSTKNTIVPIQPDPTLISSDQVEKEASTTDEQATNILTTKTRNQTSENFVARSKWVVEKPGTLYWAISPLAKWEDITEVMNEIKAYGGEMTVNAIEYDPLQMFITSAIVRISLKNGSSGQSDGGIDKFSPMKGVSGYITKTGELSMGHLPPDPLQTSLEKDYEKAVLLSQEKAGEYQEYKLRNAMNDGSYGSASTYMKESLDGEIGKEVLKKVGIGKSADNTLLVNARHKFADFKVDWQVSSFSEANAIPFEKIDRITILNDHRRAKEYVIIYTK